MSELLLCCDLDRTVLPNGQHPESMGSRDFFQYFVQQTGIKLAYVSGRDKKLVEAAIEQYHIPEPDFAITDVGSMIYHINQQQWQLDQTWIDHIATDWSDITRKQITTHLTPITELRLQEPEKQNTYKLSYYIEPELITSSLFNRINQILSSIPIAFNIIDSIDETENTGFIDILPKHASKYHAIKHLMQTQQFTIDNTLFAGDSGNDMAVIASDINAVLVKNSHDMVKHQARQKANANQANQSLYIAKGGFLGLNGNYCAGVLEGISHYHPAYIDTIQQAIYNASK